ncbi:MAG: 6-phosphofructokinase, partial [Bacilli bacterium]|nr:6-phosphofructokinase [Bacilli bacterium]
MIMKLGIITSGGDAPGMNAAIRAVVNSAVKNGIDCYGIYDGYRGIIERRMVPLDPTAVSGIETRGGTILGTVRYPEFKLLEVRKEAASILKQMGIQALVCIGGDGTYRGAIGLTKLGINCVGLPGTIDNDIASTDQTLG